ncbi:MAG: 3-phosphoshikimate 1-carboxyvinyltransferase, partial [Spirochaetes bacterium]|nr:3-phosphoshikimate 1-carboxyvinyltransferase [Spirochaetota bacterium]MBU0956548.1 3-phosphoshikimate 1-carboxyvinyltransferase [Spirochaetota bacterium]
EIAEASDNSGTAAIRIKQPASLQAFDFDATECPDLFPPLVALASACNGISRIQGAGRLRHKESDRASALSSEFGKLGIRVVCEGNLMTIHGGRPSAAAVQSHGDHRIAMAAAVAALRASGPVVIHGSEAVSKSWPAFFEDLVRLGVQIDE